MRRESAEEFLEHAKEEQEHADIVAERITQLGGEPNFSPEGLATRSHSQYVEGSIAARYGARGPGRRADRGSILQRDHPLSGRRRSDHAVAMEQILGKEEEHADDMKKLLDTLSQDERFAERAEVKGKTK
jgi:bacterioferritin